jgi:cysteinyl-tRNA synthetase
VKLYNSLTKQLEDFTPIKNGQVKLYSCGPTVYNNLHIGNLSAFIYADLLRRTLQANGYEVEHVMNITDVDDKTIRDGKLGFPGDEPMDALKKLTDKYSKVFKEDLAATGNNLDDMTFISAVESIPDMVTLIQRIFDQGIAYVADDGVYFSVSQYTAVGHKYGLLHKVDVSASQERVANDEYDKDSASDFALWKKSGPDEPAWPATFVVNGEEVDMPGRPGWHIECSAMSEKLLGTPFDIHTGGIDLKFPHHENEIAQTCSTGSTGLANYFVHNNHILVNGKKMSKSLGNFYTLRDIEERGFSAQAFRLMVLESHYHSESNFSWDILQASQNRLKNWQAVIDTHTQLEMNQDEDVIKEITKALWNNLSSPDALKSIDLYFDKVSQAHQSPHQSVVGAIEKLLGLQFTHTDISDEQKQLLQDREKARADKDWAKSDEIRDKLKEQGIIVRDDANGQIWSRA